MKSAMGAWHGFAAGERVIMLIETRGTTADEEEVTYPAGTCALIGAVADFGTYQGNGVDLVIGDGNNTICNSFDDRDVKELGGLPFRSI